MTREDLQIVADQKYNFAVAPGKTGAMVEVMAVDWEPTDGKIPWRLALHPWVAGLGPSRINPRINLSGELKNRPSMNYAKANGDASNPNFFTASPKVTTLSPTITLVYYNESVELRYGGAAYGGVSYMGPAPSASPVFIGVRNFNGKAYFGGGQYLYSIDSAYTFNVAKDFGAGKTVTDIEPFNNELIIAMGETENIWKMDTSEVFTQSTEAVYATALGKAGNQLWRSRDSNKLSNCIENPLTLTEWVPASGSEYEAGDTTYAVHDLIEYGGSIAAVRPDGVFFPDSETEFRNQTPQLAFYPDANNGKGAFVAKGYLFVPSIIGLLQVTIGSAPRVGPEHSQRPDYRFRVRGGVEWNGDIYVICTDEAESEETFICKMVEDNSGLTEHLYVYHEWLRLGGTSKSYVIVMYTEPTNPTMIASYGNDLKYWKMGRGSGPDADDSNYELATTYSIEPGLLMPVSDLAVKIDLVGVKIVAKQVDLGTIKAQYDMDQSGVWRDMTTNPDGSGIVNIMTEGVLAESRYAPPNTIGHHLELKVSGTMPSGQLGTDRTEIQEVWAFGNAIPDSTDIISMELYADRGARVFGLRQGRSSGGTYEQFRNWRNSGEILIAKIPDYNEEQNVRVRVIDVSSKNVEVLKDGKSQVKSDLVRVTFRRVDFSGDLDGE